MDYSLIALIGSFGIQEEQIEKLAPITAEITETFTFENEPHLRGFSLLFTFSDGLTSETFGIPFPS